MLWFICKRLVYLVIVVLIILSLMFGGFQKGTKSGSLGPVIAAFRRRRGSSAVPG